MFIYYWKPLSSPLKVLPNVKQNCKNLTNMFNSQSTQLPQSQVLVSFETAEGIII